MYADDLVMFLTPVPSDLQAVEEILRVFEGASGLACNMSKCHIAPIRCEPQDIDIIKECFPCAISDFPMKYLGIPLSVTKLPKVALQPILDRVANRLPIWKGQLMNKSALLALIKTTMSAIPIHTLISIKVPNWFIKALEKIMRAFLWTGTEVVNGGKCLVAWSKVQRPLRLGWLGIHDLKRFGLALRLHWLWLQLTELDRCW